MIFPSPAHGRAPAVSGQKGAARHGCRAAQAGGILESFREYDTPAPALFLAKTGTSEYFVNFTGSPLFKPKDLCYIDKKGRGRPVPSTRKERSL